MNGIRIHTHNLPHTEDLDHRRLKSRRASSPIRDLSAICESHDHVQSNRHNGNHPDFPLRPDLLSENALQGNGICSEFGYPFPQFLHSHSLFVEIESEQCFVIDVRLLGDVETCGVACDKLLGYFLLRIVELLKQVWLRLISHVLLQCKGGAFSHTEIVK